MLNTNMMIVHNNQPVLSICIPIYNRAEYLKRQFEQFLQCKELFGDKIQLYISDNCSEEDLDVIAEYYSRKGLLFEYSRNNENIGPDANFIKCFNSAKGKYVWLLGSDDIPVDGFVPKLVEILENHDYDYVFLNHQFDDGILSEYNSATDILEKVHVWITFISANIFRTEYVGNVRGKDYLNTNLIQVPFFLEGIVAGGTKAIYNCFWIQKGSDSANNGGYNLFKVFVVNLLGILKEKITSGQLTRKDYEVAKKSIYCNFIAYYVFDILIIKDKDKVQNFHPDHAWRILFKYYGKYFYFYTGLARVILIRFYKKTMGRKVWWHA